MAHVYEFSLRVHSWPVLAQARMHVHAHIHAHR